jgi:hypothetical protein
MNWRRKTSNDVLLWNICWTFQLQTGNYWLDEEAKYQLLFVYWRKNTDELRDCVLLWTILMKWTTPWFNSSLFINQAVMFMYYPLDSKWPFFSLPPLITAPRIHELRAYLWDEAVHGWWDRNEWKGVKRVFLKDVSKLISELSYNLEGRKLQIWIQF